MAMDQDPHRRLSTSTFPRPPDSTSGSTSNTSAASFSAHSLTSPSSPPLSSDSNDQSALPRPKRRRHHHGQTKPLEASSASEDDDRFASPPKYRRASRGSGSAVGQKAWEYQKVRRKAAKAGDLAKAGALLPRFKEKVKELDLMAEVSQNGLEVRCGSCGMSVTMRAPHEIRRFKEHRESKKCQGIQRRAQHTPSLSAFGFGKRTSASHLPPTAVTQVPCPGLTRQQYPKVDLYLRRAATPGGGSRPKPVLAQAMFMKSCAELTTLERQAVARREFLEYKWVNKHAAGAVHSTACQRTVRQPRLEMSTSIPEPCDDCLSLLHVRVFQTALNRDMPREAVLKFVPKEYRCAELGEIYLQHRGVRELVEAVSASILPFQYCQLSSLMQHAANDVLVRFASGALDGRYQSNDVFIGLIKAMAAKADRLEHGKSLKNMKYDEQFDRVCTILALVSPRAYKTFRYHFGGRTIRSMQYVLYYSSQVTTDLSCASLQDDPCPYAQVRIRDLSRKP